MKCLCGPKISGFYMLGGMKSPHKSTYLCGAVFWQTAAGKLRRAACTASKVKVLARWRRPEGKVESEVVPLGTGRLECRYLHGHTGLNQHGRANGDSKW